MTAPHIAEDRLKMDVEAAVAAAEKRTSAEFVCAMATESGRYDRAESLGGLLVALIALAAVNWIALISGEGSWTARGPHFGWQCVAVVAGFIVGSIVFSHVHALRRVFTGQREMEAETLRAAMHVFASPGLRRTRGRGGILIYVSLFERRVVVEADDGVVRAGGRELLERLRDIAAAELKAGHVAAAFTESIGAAVEPLASALPIQPRDEDELTNHLLVFHPRP